MSPFIIERTQRQGRELILTLKGELDLATAPVLDDELTRAQTTDAPAIVVDLEQLDFIDSSGLGVLLRHASSDQRLRVTRGSPQVQQILEISGVVDYLRFAPEPRPD
jgi:anti-sigma B factor antagonist